MELILSGESRTRYRYHLRKQWESPRTTYAGRSVDCSDEAGSARRAQWTVLLELRRARAETRATREPQSPGGPSERKGPELRCPPE